MPTRDRIVAEFLAKTRTFAEVLIDCEEDRTPGRAGGMVGA
jgi:hypothetical protein